MSSNSKQFKIYGPADFQETWKKFLEICKRDGQSGSELIRIWVEDYVSRKDPANPQRPISAWVPGHPDQEKVQEQEYYAWLVVYAEKRSGEIRYGDIVRYLQEAGVPPRTRADMAAELAKKLLKDGIGVVR